MTIPRDQPEYSFEAWVENNSVRGHVERNSTPHFSATDTDFTDLEYDHVDSSIEFHALDDIYDFEATANDFEGGFKDDELGEPLLGRSSALTRINLRETLSLIGIQTMTLR